MFLSLVTQQPHQDPIRNDYYWVCSIVHSRALLICSFLITFNITVHANFSFLLTSVNSFLMWRNWRARPKPSFLLFFYLTRCDDFRLCSSQSVSNRPFKLRVWCCNRLSRDKASMCGSLLSANCIIFFLRESS